MTFLTSLQKPISLGMLDPGACFFPESTPISWIIRLQSLTWESEVMFALALVRQNISEYLGL